jgi:hypothetical protein
VLHREHVDSVDVQKSGGAPVGGEVALIDLESDTRRIRVPPSGIVHRQNEAVRVGQFLDQRIREVRRERRNAAVPRQVIAKDCESLDLGRRVYCVHR